MSLFVISQGNSFISVSSTSNPPRIYPLSLILLPIHNKIVLGFVETLPNSILILLVLPNWEYPQGINEQVSLLQSYCPSLTSKGYLQPEQSTRINSLYLVDYSGRPRNFLHAYTMLHYNLSSVTKILILCYMSIVRRGRRDKTDGNFVMRTVSNNSMSFGVSIGLFYAYLLFCAINLMFYLQTLLFLKK